MEIILEKRQKASVKPKAPPRLNKLKRVNALDIPEDVFESTVTMGDTHGYEDFVGGIDRTASLSTERET